MTKRLPVMYKRCGLRKIYLIYLKYKYIVYEEQYRPTGNKLLNINLHNIWSGFSA